MKMTDLKKQLSLMEKEELVNLICRLYKGSTQSRDMLDSKRQIGIAFLCEF